LIGPKERAKSAADRHSRFVRLAKWLLPVLGLLIALAVAGRMWLVAHLPGLNMPAVLFSKNGLTMVEPRLTGRSRDRAYDIGATRATQEFLTPKVVQLEQLAGRIEMADNGWAKIAAKAGTYDGTDETMRLVGAVTVTTSTGYLLEAQDAAIELAKGNMVTDNSVRINGPTGWLEAGAARVTDGGATIQFSKGVHMTIVQSDLPAPDGSAPGAPAPGGAVLGAKPAAAPATGATP
jgi:lipopolysaccharide export system protein LptC